MLVHKPQMYWAWPLTLMSPCRTLLSSKNLDAKTCRLVGACAEPSRPKGTVRISMKLVQSSLGKSGHSSSSSIRNVRSDVVAEETGKWLHVFRLSASSTTALKIRLHREQSATC